MKTKQLCRLYATTLFFIISLSAPAQFIDKITCAGLPTQNNNAYQTFSNYTLTKGYTYAGNIAKDLTETTFRFRKESPSGIVTTASISELESLYIEWDNQTNAAAVLNIYGKNDPYKSSADLYNSNKGKLLCTLQKGQQMPKITQGYKYIGICADDKVVYLNSITFVWKKLTQSLSFAQPQVLLHLSDDGNTIKVDATDVHGAVSYHSSNPQVATVDPVTGQLHLVNTGTATITATAAETERYAEKTVHYVLHVLPKHEYKAHFDFTRPSSLTPQYAAKSKVDTLLTFVNNEVTVGLGKHPERTSFTAQFDTNYMYVFNGMMYLKVPEGCLIKEFSITTKAGKFPFQPQQATFGLTLKDKHNVLALDVTYTGDYQLKMGSTGYATFSSAHAYTLPEDLQGATVEIAPDGTTAKATYRFQPGNTIPANTGILLRGKPGNYYLRTVADGSTVLPVDANSLQPALSDNPITAPADQQFFIFSKKENVLGFFWQRGSTQGDGVRGIRNKAYLAVPVNQSTHSAGFRLNQDETTGINSLPSDVQGKQFIYTLTGTRVNLQPDALPRGIYLINGKKTVIK